MNDEYLKARDAESTKQHYEWAKRRVKECQVDDYDEIRLKSLGIACWEAAFKAGADWAYVQGLKCSAVRNMRRDLFILRDIVAGRLSKEMISRVLHEYDSLLTEWESKND